MALFQKQDSCFSSKAATACGCPAESLRLPTRLRSRRGRSAEINVRFAPPIMCRLTFEYHTLLHHSQTCLMLQYFIKNLNTILFYIILKHQSLITYYKVCLNTILFYIILKLKS